MVLTIFSLLLVVYIFCSLFCCIVNLYPIDFHVLFCIVRDSIILFNMHCQKIPSASHGFILTLFNHTPSAIYVTENFPYILQITIFVHALWVLYLLLRAFFPHKEQKSINSCTCPLFIIFICVTHVLLNWNSIGYNERGRSAFI